MNPDLIVFRQINSFAGRSELFDKFLESVLDLPSVKMLPLVAALIYLWASDRPRGREAIGVGLTAAIFSLLLSRLIQNFGLQRPRPLHAGLEGFRLPYGVDHSTLTGWSSFPSDHAALAFALAAAVWIGWRRLGLACFLWALLIVSLPRIYLGKHYPSDILAGALLGVLLTAAFSYLGAGKWVAAQASRFAQHAPGLFAIAAFIVLFQFVTMFADVRVLMDLPRELACSLGGSVADTACIEIEERTST